MTNTDYSAQDNLIPMGTVIGAFGVKGWVKIKTGTHAPDSLSSYKKLQLLVDNKWQKFTITSYTINNKVFHAKLEGIDDRDAAMLLRGVTVAVPRDEFPDTTENEYYLADLLGLQVYNKQQEYMGVVINFMETGPHTVLVIVDNKNKHVNEKIKIERLIPFVAQYVCDVNLLTKQIIVDWGLDY